MLTGEIRSQVDAIWNAFWTGGISNPLEVIEQITYLLFLRRLDELQEVEELKATRLKKPIERRIFPKGKDAKGMPYEEYRWSRFKNAEARAMYDAVSEHVFPWLRTLGGNGSAYAQHMKDARFTIPTPQLLAKVVDLIEKVPMEDRDTKGDLYEYMLGKIASAGQNGQFRTPRHIIKLMVEMVEPKPKDVICDPACGTAGFLIAAGEYLRQHHPEILRDDKLRAHFHNSMFHGFDFDSTMLRIGSMNMLLHGIENPSIVYRDSLAQDHAGETEKYTLVLANPPFAGSLDYETAAKDLLEVVKTKKTELLFFALFLRLLKPGGRAAVIVPDAVLFGSSKLRETFAELWTNVQLLHALHCRPRRGLFENEVSVLMGSNSEFLKETRAMATWLDVERLYLCHSGSGLALKLLPLVQVGPSPQSAKNACYFFSRLERDGGARFISYHFIDKPELTGQFDQALEAIKLLTEP